MISLLPSYQETIVLPRPAMDVYQRLAASTSNRTFLQPDESQLLFTGWVREERFRISQRVRRANYYMPLVIGRIESTSSGCILLLSYTLFPTTALLLKLWTLLIILGATMGSFQYKNLFVLFVAAAILALIYFVVWSNFKLHLTPTKEAIQLIVS